MKTALSNQHSAGLLRRKRSSSKTSRCAGVFALRKIGSSGHRCIGSSEEKPLSIIENSSLILNDLMSSQWRAFSQGNIFHDCENRVVGSSLHRVIGGKNPVSHRERCPHLSSYLSWLASLTSSIRVHSRLFAANLGWGPS